MLTASLKQLMAVIPTLRMCSNTSALVAIRTNEYTCNVYDLKQ